MPACDGLGCQAADTISFAFGPAVGRIADAAVRVGQGMPAFWPLCAAMAGAVAASLAGVVVDRLPRMLGWHAEPAPGLGLSSPPSRCDSCGSRIPPLALVPVAGWIATRGRCETCFEPVPATYPIVEGATATASLVIAALLGPTFAALCACLLLWALVAVSWLDWRERVIPDGATVPLFFAGLLASPFEPDPWARGCGGFVAMGCMWVTFKLVSAVKDLDAMAMGDVALAAALGAWVGLCATPAFLLLSCAAYLAYAVPLRMRSGRVWVPMGPALSAGAMATILTGVRFTL